MKLIVKIFQLILLPAIIAGVFFVWSLPRITTDYNFNTDELIYLERTNYAKAYFSGDYRNSLWSDWGAYDQPQLTNYLYSLVPGDRALLDVKNSPCTTKNSQDFYGNWACLDGPPISTWPTNLAPLKAMVTKARILATAVSALSIASTYYLGLVVGGPISGIIAAIYLGYYSFFKNLSTMAMMDQLLLLNLNLQLIFALLIAKRKKVTFWQFLLLGLFTGLSISTKLSAIIPTIIIYSYLFMHSLIKKNRSAIYLLLSYLISLFIFISLHPTLWQNPLAGVTNMISWRVTQLQTQSNSTYLPTNIPDKVIYSFNETFTSWNLDSFNAYSFGFILVAVIGLLCLIKLNPSFAYISLSSAITFVTILPVKWNRYLLPIMPSVAVWIAFLPSLFISYVTELKLTRYQFKKFGLGIILGILCLLLPYLLGSLVNSLTIINLIILMTTILLTIQGYLVTRSMLHAFSHASSTPTPHFDPIHKFSLIIPAKNESSVIGQTIASLARLTYPNNLYEVLVVIKSDDKKTLSVAQSSINKFNSSNIKIVPIEGMVDSKAYSLNLGVSLAKNNFIGIFDAEDEVHPALLQSVNNYLITYPNTHAVQAPVHLTNLTSSWFSSLNSVEYYFWFRSVLPYLKKFNTIPLGGNTIFVHKTSLKNIGGYDESCLTEDAELGIRLSSLGANIGIIDDPGLATLEETPRNEIDLIRQRSRWDQGYLQVLSKGSWQHLSLKQRLMTIYILSQPIFRHLSFLNMIFSPLLVLAGSISVWVALASFIPGYFLLIQLALYCLGLNDLANLHNIKISPWRYAFMLICFVPYQALLSLATIRAISKIITGNYSWDKTEHSNLHRPSIAILQS